MPSAPQDVRSLLASHPALLTALARGMINAVGAARWLKKEYSLEMEVESIARIIREFDAEAALDDWQTGEEALKGGVHRLRSDMVLFLIQRSGKTQKRLAQILGRLEAPGLQAFRVEPTRHHYQLVVEGDRRQEVERQLGDDPIERVFEGLLEVSVTVKETLKAPAPALSAALRAYHERNVEVFFATAGPAGLTMLVNDAQRITAHELIEELTASDSGD